MIISDFRVIRTEKTTGRDTYVMPYFSNPKHVPNKRSQSEKLEEISIRLSASDLDDNDRFNLLILQKSLCVLAYGENSPETLMSPETAALYDKCCIICLFCNDKCYNVGVFLFTLFTSLTSIER